ncbi:MAG: flavin oxidoreductase/NADH oxidase, partial [Sporomusa sp.]|nr:flavin oxidoreductase/NADH oxidase [Sporomusa sp.]
ISDIKNMGLDLPFSSNLEFLKKELVVEGKTIQNRFVIQPMEGCDGTAAGKPSELTERRYQRFAQSGAGLAWFEATAVVAEGRANPRQLLINEDTKESLAKLLSNYHETAQQEFGSDHKPYTILQLTHSGRYSKPTGQAAPIVAVENPYLDKAKDLRVISDSELEQLEDRYVDATVIAADIGFDAVDLKSCHGYLLAELLGAHTRKGIYGGTFENRTKFLCNIVDKVKAKVGNRIQLAVRMNAYDAVPYPYGWGVDSNDFHIPDLTEPKRLAKILADKGVSILNVTVGNPYYNPHVNRPFDNGPYIPTIHPLSGTQSILSIARDIQVAVPKLNVVASGLSWLRQYGAQVAAGCLENNWFPLVGFGRQAFAYPTFARDILEKDGMDPKKVCIACSKCSAIMRDGGTTGCVIRDSKVYVPFYRAGREGKVPFETGKVGEHV